MRVATAQRNGSFPPISDISSLSRERWRVPIQKLLRQMGGFSRAVVLHRCRCHVDDMSWRLILLALASLGRTAAAQSVPPLYDPVILNIGINCQWQKPCMDRQHSAMRHSLKYVAKYHPPIWRIQQCNRNASRNRERVDWIGFNNCVRNAALSYEPPRAPQFQRTTKPHRHRSRHRHRHRRR